MTSLWRRPIIKLCAIHITETVALKFLVSPKLSNKNFCSRKKHQEFYPSKFKEMAVGPSKWPSRMQWKQLILNRMRFAAMRQDHLGLKANFIRLELFRPAVESSLQALRLRVTGLVLRLRDEIFQAFAPDLQGAREMWAQQGQKYVGTGFDLLLLWCYLKWWAKQMLRYDQVCQTQLFLRPVERKPNPFRTLKDYYK